FAHGAMSLAAARHKGERIDQAGLSARPVSNYRDVPDFGSLVLPHTHAPRCLGEPPDCGWELTCRIQQRGALYAREYLRGRGRVAVMDGRGRFTGGGAGKVHRSGVGEEQLFPAQPRRVSTGQDLMHEKPLVQWSSQSGSGSSGAQENSTGGLVDWWIGGLVNKRADQSRLFQSTTPSSR